MADSSRADSFVRRIDFASDNLAVQWSRFKSEFQIYAIAKGVAKMEEEEQIANMLLLMGPESVPIYQQFSFNTSTNKRTLVNTMALFAQHFEPVKNLIYERVKFNQLKQDQSQSIHQFIVSLQTQAENCEYGDMKNELIRDRIVVGVHDSKLREYLINIEDLDLPTCIQKAKQYVANHEQASRMFDSATVAENVDYLQKKRQQDSQKTDKPGKEKLMSEPCIYCNKRIHKWGTCPAAKSTCHACKKQGHWARSKACKKKMQVNEVQNESNDNDLDGLFLGTDSE